MQQGMWVANQLSRGVQSRTGNRKLAPSNAFVCLRHFCLSNLSAALSSPNSVAGHKLSQVEVSAAQVQLRIARWSPFSSDARPSRACWVEGFHRLHMSTLKTTWWSPCCEGPQGCGHHLMMVDFWDAQQFKHNHGPPGAPMLLKALLPGCKFGARHFTQLTEPSATRFLHNS